MRNQQTKFLDTHEAVQCLDHQLQQIIDTSPTLPEKIRRLEALEAEEPSLGKRMIIRVRILRAMVLA